MRPIIWLSCHRSEIDTFVTCVPSVDEEEEAKDQIVAVAVNYSLFESDKGVTGGTKRG